MADENLLTVPEVASRLRVHPESIRRWLREGRIHGVRIGGTRAGYRIPAGEVERFLKEAEKAS